MTDLNTRTSDAETGVNCPSESNSAFNSAIVIIKIQVTASLYRTKKVTTNAHIITVLKHKQKDGDEIFYMATGYTNAYKQCTGLAQSKSGDLNKKGPEELT